MAIMMTLPHAKSNHVAEYGLLDRPYRQIGRGARHVRQGRDRLGRYPATGGHVLRTQLEQIVEAARDGMRLLGLGAFATADLNAASALSRVLSSRAEG
jgi:hypothetical protein